MALLRAGHGALRHRHRTPQQLWRFEAEELNPELAEVQSAMSYTGLTPEILLGLKPWDRAMALAEALMQYGRGDEGPGGWARDIIPAGICVQWFGGKRPQGWRYLADEDVEFRRMLRERR